MTIKYLHIETNQIYFLTITCYKWINLFSITNFYNHIYKWFQFMESNEKKIIGYVIMPNHLHLLLYIPQKSEPINKIVSEGKRFFAYKIITILKKENKLNLLNTLKNSVTEYDKKRGKIHNVFQPNSDITSCLSENKIIQILDYIHFNPVSPKWNLVDDFTTYKHSSACFYELNFQSEYKITHFKDIIG